MRPDFKIKSERDNYEHKHLNWKKETLTEPGSPLWSFSSFPRDSPLALPDKTLLNDGLIG